MARTVEIVEVRPVNSGGNLKAFVTIRIGELKVRDCRIVQQPGQEAWVSPPQREYEKDGQKKYYAVVEFSGQLKEEISRAVLTAWSVKQGVEGQQARGGNADF